MIQTSILSSLLAAGFLLCVGVSESLAQTAAGDRQKSNDLVREASRSYNVDSQKVKALGLLEKAIAADPTNLRAYKVRVKIHQADGSLAGLAKVEADFTKIIQLDPQDKRSYQDRGIARFFLGKIEGSIKDFDAYIADRPREGPYHWQRGIALYYAEDFEGGRKQFEDHQKVNSNDVENAAWHYICVARIEGVEEARKSLIPIQGDRRVPMAQIHDLFAGTGTVEDVLKAAQTPARGTTEEEKQIFVNDQLCYAHLYLALYYEAANQPDESLKHIKLAAGKYARPHYMGQVARIHHELRSKEP